MHYNPKTVLLEQVPDCVSDAAAVFAEPLAAACRILEQGLVPLDADAAVLGDGKLGLLIAEVLARRGTTAAGEVRPRALKNKGQKTRPAPSRPKSLCFSVFHLFGFVASYLPGFWAISPDEACNCALFLFL